MPGGRLTHRDRQRIAAGLAKGLGFSEIARRLARPTSTITREVARNGGVNVYRAGPAHRAAVRRTRRKWPAPPVSSAPVPDGFGRDPRVMYEVTEQLTGTLVQTGLPRMMARVLACLYTTDSARLTAADLVKRLRVSPASISKAVGYLEEQELIKRERDDQQRPNRGRDRYIIGADVWLQSLLASAQRNAMLADSARRAATILGTMTPAGTRLEDAAEFLEHTSHEIVHAVQRWRQNHPTHPTTAH